VVDEGTEKEQQRYRRRLLLKSQKVFTAIAKTCTSCGLHQNYFGMRNTMNTEGGGRIREVKRGSTGGGQRSGSEE
jgi:hypothetical protein